MENNKFYKIQKIKWLIECALDNVYITINSSIKFDKFTCILIRPSNNKTKTIGYIVWYNHFIGNYM